MSCVFEILTIVFESFDAKLVQIVVVLDYFVEITDESGLI
jgi:hypothetical protein